MRISDWSSDVCSSDLARCAIDSFDNSRCIADLTLTDTPAETLVTGDAARAAALHLLALQAVVTAHEQTGGAEALMEIARDYAVTRKAFGQPIGAFQSIKHRIAELYGLVELARANAIHAAAREGQHDFIIAAAAARLSATEAYDTAARSEEHTSELQSLMRTSYAVVCLKKKNIKLQIQKYENSKDTD